MLTVNRTKASDHWRGRLAGHIDNHNQVEVPAFEVGPMDILVEDTVEGAESAVDVVDAADVEGVELDAAGLERSLPFEVQWSKERWPLVTE